MAAILPCDCTSVHLFPVKSGMAKYEDKPRCMVPWANQGNGATFQDARYGKGLRLHNKRVKGGPRGHTCTVCGKRKD